MKNINKTIPSLKKLYRFQNGDILDIVAYGTFDVVVRQMFDIVNVRRHIVPARDVVGQH